MKNAVILHGTGATPNSQWIPSIRKYLESLGYKVWVPQLPELKNLEENNKLDFVLERGKFDKDTILIGHSSGCPLALSLLERVCVKKTILVAGYVTLLSKEKDPLIKDFNWSKIKKNAKEFIFINSDNDPWGCDDKQGRVMLEKLGGILIIPHEQGHFGSDRFNQPYKKFPLLEKLLA